MRTPPGPIPSVLPDMITTVTRLHALIHRPITRLADASIFSLMNPSFEGSGWITGSAVWLTAVFGKDPDLNGDFDIIFSDKHACEHFAASAHAQLNYRINKTPLTGGFGLTTNKLGGSRITHPDGRGIMDVWALENESIAECISAFPGGNHVRCAYKISRKAEAANLTRVVSIPKRKNKSYPGTDDTNAGDVVLPETGGAPYRMVMGNLLSKYSI